MTESTHAMTIPCRKTNEQLSFESMEIRPRQKDKEKERGKIDNFQEEKNATTMSIPERA
jgi:hypothetical protein